jgi:hypothetical protein
VPGPAFPSRMSRVRILSPAPLPRFRSQEDTLTGCLLSFLGTYGGTFNAQTGGSQWIYYAFHFQIKDSTDSLNTVWRISPSGANIIHSPGNCTP